ncbi:unnamed protein product [Dicrocoelium dendriticum]|nr:unnamed protein product [Dicrocoelium dendriticum]CAH8602281.1 unnamed protein product [Dicrocoelium dendriticum]
MSTTSPFNPWKTYYESPEEQAAIKERAKFREAMKAEYRKQLTNPFKPRIGMLHDPAMQRWFSARVTHSEYLQPTPKLGLMFGTIVVVAGLLCALLGHKRPKILRQIENGELSYRERVLNPFGK